MKSVERLWRGRKMCIFVYTLQIFQCVYVYVVALKVSCGRGGVYRNSFSRKQCIEKYAKKTSCTFKMCRKHVQEAYFRHITKVIAKLTTQFLSYENMFRGTCQKRRCNACMLLTLGLQGVEAIL